MNRTLLVAACIVAMSPPYLSAQVIGRPTASVNNVLDSLRVGRRRWDSAQVGEYRIQSHMGCFCVYTLERMRNELPLLTVRNGTIVARERGMPNKPPSPAFTIDSLFAEVKRDAQSTGRIIERLDLHPIYGFPVTYHARDPEIPDDWLRLQVDSFAVIKKR
jgi:hypothetical protein